LVPERTPLGIVANDSVQRLNRQGRNISEYLDAAVLQQEVRCVQGGDRGAARQLRNDDGGSSDCWQRKIAVEIVVAVDEDSGEGTPQHGRPLLRPHVMEVSAPVGGGVVVERADVPGAHTILPNDQDGACATHDRMPRPTVTEPPPATLDPLDQVHPSAVRARRLGLARRSLQSVGSGFESLTAHSLTCAFARKPLSPFFRPYWLNRGMWRASMSEAEESSRGMMPGSR
jgi:hypothetical protein